MKETFFILFVVDLAVPADSAAAARSLQSFKQNGTAHVNDKKRNTYSNEFWTLHLIHRSSSVETCSWTKKEKRKRRKIGIPYRQPTTRRSVKNLHLHVVPPPCTRGGGQCKCKNAFTDPLPSLAPAIFSSHPCIWAFRQLLQIGLNAKLMERFIGAAANPGGGSSDRVPPISHRGSVRSSIFRRPNANVQRKLTIPQLLEQNLDSLYRS